jgi:DNA invertase Pin-like site-specific DNA recombinase
MPKAYSYLRFSTPEQMKGDSLRRQTALAQEYAQRHGLTLDTELTYKDLGVSAFRGKNIETGALGAFLKAIEDGLVERGDYLLVESLDRISRKVARRAVRIVEDIVDAGVVLVTLNDGKQYTKDSLDGFDFMMALLVLMRGNEESLTKSKRNKAAWVGKRQKLGEKRLTAVCPGWLRPVRDASGKLTGHELIPERATIVRWIIHEMLSGSGRDAIVRELNRRGEPTWKAWAPNSRRKRPTSWHHAYIQKLIRNRALIGELVPHVRVHDAESRKWSRKALDPVPDYYPAVIDIHTFESLQHRLHAPRGRYAASEVFHNILSGLALCPLCGAQMVGGAFRGLMCTKGRNAAGCSARIVRLLPIESTLATRCDQILGEMPSADSALEERLWNARNSESALVDEVQQVSELLMRHRSEALAAQLVKLELDLHNTRAKREAAEQAAAAAESRVLKLRSARLAEAFKQRPKDADASLDFSREAQRNPSLTHERLKAVSAWRRLANAALRDLLKEVVVDYRTGNLEFRWRHASYESSLMFMWPREKDQKG